MAPPTDISAFLQAAGKKFQASWCTAEAAASAATQRLPIPRLDDAARSASAFLQSNLPVEQVSCSELVCVQDHHAEQQVEQLTQGATDFHADNSCSLHPGAAPTASHQEQELQQQHQDQQQTEDLPKLLSMLLPPWTAAEAAPPLGLPAPPGPAAATLEAAKQQQAELPGSLLAPEPGPAAQPSQLGPSAAQLKRSQDKVLGWLRGSRPRGQAGDPQAAAPWPAQRAAPPARPPLAQRQLVPKGRSLPPWPLMSLQDPMQQQQPQQGLSIGNVNTLYLCTQPLPEAACHAGASALPGAAAWAAGQTPSAGALPGAAPAEDATWRAYLARRCQAAAAAAAAAGGSQQQQGADAHGDALSQLRAISAGVHQAQVDICSFLAAAVPVLSEAAGGKGQLGDARQRDVLAGRPKQPAAAAAGAPLLPALLPLPGQLFDSDFIYRMRGHEALASGSSGGAAAGGGVGGSSSRAAIGRLKGVQLRKAAERLGQGSGAAPARVERLGQRRPGKQTAE